MMAGTIRKTRLVKKNNILDEGEVYGMINLFQDTKCGSLDSKENIESLNFTAGKKLIKPRSKRQVEYFNLVRKKDLVFCCGPAGTGKTFLLSLAREYAQKKNICTCHADLDPQRRLFSNKGDALSLYKQLIANLSQSPIPSS